MNYNDDDNNPFADSSIRQATAASYSNQPALNEYNPFTNTTVPARPAPPVQQPSTPAVLSAVPTTPAAAAYSIPTYAPVTTPFASQSSTDKYGKDTKPTTAAAAAAPPSPATRLDLSQYERQQAELDEREKRLAERERAISNTGKIGQRDNNFPPLPNICPCKPCFYQDISIEIPPQFQLWVRYIYYLWLVYSLTLLLNMIAGLSYFVVDKDGAATFGLSLVYLVLFVPLSYLCWFRPIYRAFREDSASDFMIFFLIFFLQLVITVLQFFGIANLGCGFILMIQLFAAGGKKILVGLLVMLVTCSFAMIALVGSLLLIKTGNARTMDIIGIHKKADTSISDPTIRSEARRYSLRTQLAFLPDQIVGRSWFFRLLTFVYYYFFVFFHAFQIEGIEKIDADQGCLFIARHSTHNGDILGTIVCFYHMTGRVLRSLIHRSLTPFFPVLRLMGAVPGEPKSALSLLKSGFWVAVVPGGADEGMIGHENAYKVSWPKKRKGFAQIAVDAQVPIVPLFLANVEEMRWNPILCLWNFVGLGRWFAGVLERSSPATRPSLLLLASTAWFLVTFIQIPIPAKLTLVIGDPVPYDAEKDSIDEIVERSRRALQALIDKRQPHGKSYSNAVNERIQCLVKSSKKVLFQVSHHL